VEFSPDGGFAFRPGELLVPLYPPERLDRARETLEEYYRDRDLPWPRPPTKGDHDEAALDGPTGSFWRFRRLPDVLGAIEALRLAGIRAQVNHVLFATCCPPHPGIPRANPFYANPFYANPFYANPFYANAGGGCGCGGGTGANPFYANPFYANPFYANPFYANTNPMGWDAETQASGRRASSARPVPASEGELQGPEGERPVRVAVLDTGYADAAFAPTILNQAISGDKKDVPDVEPDQYLDPVAGHGTFIAGVIKQKTSKCSIRMVKVIEPEGDGNETAIADALEALLAAPDPPHFVNLSFGGYSMTGMDRLSEAVAKLIDAGVVVVASAGNDATCAPTYPAALPGVVGVGALDAEDFPASFSNYGWWVRACTLGVDVVSTFFRGFDGREGVDDEGVDIDRFTGWAKWSGTSFAAPRVVAALVRKLVELRVADTNAAPQDAVRELIDDPERMRMPMLGTIVMPSGNNWDAVKMAIKRRQG
jgi:hypothetical protein